MSSQYGREGGGEGACTKPAQRTEDSPLPRHASGRPAHEKSIGPSISATAAGAPARIPTGGGTRRVRLVREKGRGVSSQYGREGGGGMPLSW